MQQFLLSLLCAAGLLFPAANATAQGTSSAVIAGFNDDFSGGSPSAGWSYLWNPTSVLGDSASYQALPWAGGSQYTAGTGSPSILQYNWGQGTASLAGPGPGIQDGAAADRYAIGRYTVANDGTYFLVKTAATVLNSTCSDGIEIVVLVNDVSVASNIVAGQSRVDFDLTLGALSAGDSVDVAIGPSGNAGCDFSGVDWDIAYLPASVGGSEVTYIFESVPNRMNISYNGTTRRTPFGVILPVGSNLDIAAYNQGLFAFDSWSIGGEGEQQLTVGNSDETLVAAYSDLSVSGGSIVAGYVSDWASGAPAPDWAYLWNASSPLGNPAGYSALQWNGGQYASADPSGLPYAYRFSWGWVNADVVHPGSGVQQGESTDRYGIFRYTVATSGDYYLINSAANPFLQGCSNGAEVVVLVNSVPLRAVVIGPETRESFDLTLGSLTPGDTIDVAIGPNGDDLCDTSILDWEFFRAPESVVNTPPTLADIANQSVVEGTSLTIDLSAADYDGDGLILNQTGLPSFATLTDNGDGTGFIVVSPNSGDEGTYAVEVFVNDNGVPSLGDSQTFALIVTPIYVDFFQQDGNGTLVIEAEHFNLNMGGTEAAPWTVITETSASNTEAIKSPPGRFTVPPNTSRAEYQADFVFAGSHDIWVRLRAFDTGSDRFWIELDDLGLQQVNVVPFTGDWQWVQVTYAVPLELGKHTVKILRSKKNIEIDKIVITADSSFVPTGLGPDESERIALDAFGLLSRPSNPDCVAPPRPSIGASVASEDPFPASLGFNQITKILQPPGDGSRWFLLEKQGFIRVFDAADPANSSIFVDLTGSVRSGGGEEGLLGMAFHPDFPLVPEVYVSYTAGADAALRHSRISRLILDNTDTPVNVTEQILLTLNQHAKNHNGGDIAFGPDGYLYIGFGDGGGGRDPQETGQNTTNLLASMLRIDVLGVAYPIPAYQVPPDNPFANNQRCGPTQNNPDDCPETYAWGFRNPWRWSFDYPSGKLWLADVGQKGWEEINIVENGGNYGWDCREGFHESPPLSQSPQCPTPGMIDPVSEYPHTDGNQSITGGYVYRGSAVPGLVGRYVFADYGSGRIWALQADGQGGYTSELLADTPYLISAFGMGEDGELYFADFGNGRIRRLIPAGPGNPDTIPDDLVDTGCVDSTDPTRPAQGLVPYAVNARFWSDGAVKQRWMALPDGTTVDIDAAGDFLFPSGTVLLKNFELNDQLVETRLLMRHPDGIWGGYTYEWNDTETAATRVKGGKTRIVGGQEWIYLSEGECLQCHTGAADFSLGPEIAQLNRDLIYPSTGITANQLETLDHIMMFTSPLPGPASGLPAMLDPADTGAPLDERARAYLHTNCSQCHRPGGPTPSNMDLRYTTPLPATNACDVVPSETDLGIGPNARLIAPGSSVDSVIPARMGVLDAHGMPPLGSNLADVEGVTLINGWIDSLQNCN